MSAMFPGVQWLTLTPTATLSNGIFSFRELPSRAAGKACSAALSSVQLRRRISSVLRAFLRHF